MCSAMAFAADIALLAPKAPINAAPPSLHVINDRFKCTRIAEIANLVDMSVDCHGGSMYGGKLSRGMIAPDCHSLDVGWFSILGVV